MKNLFRALTVVTALMIANSSFAYATWGPDGYTSERITTVSPSGGTWTTYGQFH